MHRDEQLQYLIDEDDRPLSPFQIDDLIIILFFLDLLILHAVTASTSALRVLLLILETTHDLHVAMVLIIVGRKYKPVVKVNVE